MKKTTSIEIYLFEMAIAGANLVLRKLASEIGSESDVYLKIRSSVTEDLKSSSREFHPPIHFTVNDA